MNLPLDPESNQNKPLKGLRVLTTRPESVSDSLRELLLQLGAEVVNCPVIEFSLPVDQSRLKSAEERLGEFSMLVFLSRRGVWGSESLLQRASRSPLLIAAIGRGTADCLREQGHEVTLVPENSNSESMADSLTEYVRQQGLTKPVLVLRGDRGSAVLPEALRRASIPFHELVVYESSDVQEADPKIHQQLAAGSFDWLTVTSSSIASNTARLFASAIGQTKIVSISPRTSKAAIEAGLTITAEATEYNAAGLAEAIAKHETRDRP